MRQKPTRMPYSCQDQFGWSGSTGWPCGGVMTMRAIGRAMSHSSRASTGHTMSPGSVRAAQRLTVIDRGIRNAFLDALSLPSNSIRGHPGQLPDENARANRHAGKTSCEDRKKHSAILCDLNAERTALQKNGIQCVNCVVLKDLIAQLRAIWRGFGPTLR